MKILEIAAEILGYLVFLALGMRFKLWLYRKGALPFRLSLFSCSLSFGYYPDEPGFPGHVGKFLAGHIRESLRLGLSPSSIAETLDVTPEQIEWVERYHPAPWEQAPRI